MAERASERIHVEADLDRCFAVASDIERFPEWAKDVKEVIVTERDDQGRAAVAQLRTAAMGRSTVSVLKYDYSEAPSAFSWTLVEGDVLNRLDGRYEFQVDGEGTRVTYTLDADASIPMPGLVKRRAVGIITSNALKELKKEVEGA